MLLFFHHQKKWQLVKKGRSRINNPTVKKGTEPLHRKVVTPKSKIKRIPGEVIERRERNKEKFNRLSLFKVQKDKVVYKSRPPVENKGARETQESRDNKPVKNVTKKGTISHQREKQSTPIEQRKSVTSVKHSANNSQDKTGDKRNSIASVKTGEVTPRYPSRRRNIVTPKSVVESPERSSSKNVHRTGEGRLSKQSVNTFNKLEVIPASPEPQIKRNTVRREIYNRNSTSQSHYNESEARRYENKDHRPRSNSVAGTRPKAGPSGTNTVNNENTEFKFKATQIDKGKAPIKGPQTLKGTRKSVSNRPKGPVKVNTFVEETTADGKPLRYKLVVDTDEKSVQAEIDPEYDDDFDDDDEEEYDDVDYEDDYEDEDDYEGDDDDEEKEEDNEVEEEGEGPEENQQLDEITSKQAHSRQTEMPSVQQRVKYRQWCKVEDGRAPLPPIETHNEEPQHDINETSPAQSPQRTNRKPPVHERLYDPDFRKNRGVPIEPEPVYFREFKSRPPKSLEHVKSRHLDQAYYEPRGEYVLESDEEHLPSFRAKPPKQLEHVQSRILNPEYFKKKEYHEGELDRNVSPTFVARPPKGLQHVQSRILDPKYFEEKKVPDDAYEKYNTEFKARVPKKLEHIQPRLLDPKKPKPHSEEEVFNTKFKANIPKSMGHVESRIMDPSFYEPKPVYVYENEEEVDTNFKAKLPKNLQHVDTRIYDERFYKKKIPPIPAEDREAAHMNTDFKARPPKALQHVQSRFFDLWYDKAASPPFESQPVFSFKRKGSFVLINVKKDANGETKTTSRGRKSNLEQDKWRKEFEEAMKPGYSNSRMAESMPDRLGSEGNPNTATSTPEKKKPWKPKKKKLTLVDKSYFDSWVMTPTHIYRDNNDMFDKNRQDVSNMWHSLAHSINESVTEHDRRAERYDKHLYY